MPRIVDIFNLVTINTATPARPRVPVLSYALMESVVLGIVSVHWLRELIFPKGVTQEGCNSKLFTVYVGYRIDDHTTSRRAGPKAPTLAS